jgi:hypothetical protein
MKLIVVLSGISLCIAKVSEILNIDSDYLNGTDELWPKKHSDRTVRLRKHEKQLMYIRVQKLSTISGDISESIQKAKLKTHTAVVFPKVDEFSQIVIPNSWPILESLYNSPTNATIVWYVSGVFVELPYRIFSRSVESSFSGKETYYIPSRTAHIKLKDGKF